MSSSTATRPVYIISDGTGITAGTMSNTLLSQFPAINFERHTIPFVDADDKVKNCIKQINHSYQAHGIRPLVFVSFTNVHFKEELEQANAVVLDLLEPFISPMEALLKADSSHQTGLSHGITEGGGYMHRIEAINYSMKYDDGVRMEGYKDADLVLVGVSRAGKTPTSLYMALHYGLKTANYPIADDDFEKGALPEALLNSRQKVFGLIIDPIQLHKIREARRPNSQYSKLSQCQNEVRQAQSFFKKYRIPFADSTAMSIEELASLVVHRMQLAVSYT